MASTTERQNSGSNPRFILSPHQQDLLFAALNSNNVSNTSELDSTNIINKDSSTIGFSESPVQAPGSGTLNGFEESPFIDYDYEFDADGSFDNFDFSAISQGQDMIGKIPESASSEGDAGETHEKRSHPDEDDDNEEGGGKRREGEEKGSRKPGRKPLTNEPTSKRKAQNRAAQRAFRDRKEKHLKDLETKVQDLEKASESANHENAMLRAKVERMAVELKEYRKKLSLSSSANRSPSTALPSYMTGRGLGNAISNPNDVNFQFEFPQFGKLPGPPLLNATTTINQNQPSASLHRSSTASNGGNISPGDKSLQTNSGYGPFSDNLGMLHNLNGPTFGEVSQPQNDMSAFAGLFSPSILNSAGKDFPTIDASPNSNASRSSSDSARLNSTGNNTMYSSPSASSNSAGSNNGQSSSCGTSPEPSGQSPANKASETTGAGEFKPTSPPIEGEKSFCEKLSMACGNPNQPIPRTMSETGLPSDSTPSLFPTGLTPGFELNNFDWFSQQNGQFDPQLFNDYREPQNNILAGNGLFDDSFFNEAIDMNQFNSPLSVEKSPVPAKKDLVSQIDEKLAAEEEVVPGEAAGQMLSCNNMWEKLQNCPSVKSGEIDMDSLCTQLQQKAKCSGEGPVIDEKDFKSVIKSMFPADGACPTAK